MYAFSARGKLLPGWPVKPEALSADGHPARRRGRADVALARRRGRRRPRRGGGERVHRASPSSSAATAPACPGTGEGNHFQSLGRGGSSPAGAPAALSIGANAAFGRTSRGGPLRLFGGLVDARLAQAQLSPASRVPFEHLLGGWDARSGDWLPAFPRPIEGWTILSGPAVADVDGDGRAEALAGSSGYRLHALGESGREPAGWPKQTGGWLLAAPAVGDVDGDRRLEVVAVTREGWLFVWDTPGAEGLAAGVAACSATTAATPDARYTLESARRLPEPRPSFRHPTKGSKHAGPSRPREHPCAEETRFARSPRSATP